MKWKEIFYIVTSIKCEVTSSQLMKQLNLQQLGNVTNDLVTHVALKSEQHLPKFVQNLSTKHRTHFEHFLINIFFKFVVQQKIN